jgi:hypothetical protein
LHVPRRGAVLGAEDDQVGALRERQLAQSFRGRAAEDDMTRNVRLLEHGGAGREQRVGFVLGEPLGAALSLLGVANVGKRKRCARPGEQSTERKRVQVVFGSVIGDDDLRGHWVPLELRFAVVDEANIRVLAIRGWGPQEV